MNLFALLPIIDRQLLGIGAIKTFSDILSAVTRFILLTNYQNTLLTFDETSIADLARMVKDV